MRLEEPAMKEKESFNIIIWSEMSWVELWIYQKDFKISWALKLKLVVLVFYDEKLL